MKKSHLPEILACVVVLLGATYFMRAWKIKTDRERCIINIRNVQQAVRGHLGMNGHKLIPLDANKMWEDIFTGPNRYIRKPICPSGGTYTYHNPKVINEPLGFLFCTCSHAETLNHKPDHTADW